MMGMMATAGTAGGGGGDIATTRVGIGDGAAIIGIDLTADGTTGTADVTVTMVGVAAS
jgi:hypothetical protein